ncbi:MAG: hypothetical protein M5U26_30175 [Planctomycetota bacterium]|nr:hypothetical protein [Planctomycetota bacterium]
MKFYFCETCGKRLTEEDVEAGKARDKKLRGVFCANCAAGILTMETLPLSEAEAQRVLNDQPGETPAAPVAKRARIASEARIPRPLRRTPEAGPAAATRSPGVALAFVGAGLSAVVLGAYLLTRSPTLRPAAPGNPSAENVPAPRGEPPVRTPSVENPTPEPSAKNLEPTPAMKTPPTVRPAPSEPAPIEPKEPKEPKSVQTAPPEPKPPLDPAQLHFDAHVKSLTMALRDGKLDEAKRLADALAAAPEAAAAPDLARGIQDLVRLHASREEAKQAAYAKLVGSEVKLETRNGARQGKVLSYEAGVLTLQAAFRINGQMRAGPEVGVLVADLTPETVAKILGPAREADSPSAWIDRALACMLDENWDAASDAAERAKPHILAPFVTKHLEARRRLHDDEAARAAWEALRARLDGAHEAAEVLALGGALGEWKLAHGRTRWAQEHRVGFREAVEDLMKRAKPILIVDFGGSKDSHAYGPLGWKDLLLPEGTYPANEGPGGLRSNHKDRNLNCQGLRGPARRFLPGEKIVVTWFNNNRTNLFGIHPKISFDDPDAPDSGQPGTWRNMVKAKLPAQQSGISVFVFDKESAGVHGLINIQCDEQAGFKCICDKIELELDFSHLLDAP